jgi:hypothetical protein
MAVGRTPEERFLQEIQDLKAQIAALQNRPLQIPYLDADPDAAYAGNVWMFQDGRIRFRLPDGTIKQVSTATSTGSTTGTSKPPVAAQPTTHVYEGALTFGESYRSSGGVSGSNHTSYLYHGNGGSSFNGNQSALIGFDYATIASALSGSTITGVWIYLNPVHTWWNSGATAWFGMHSNATKPGSYTGVVRNFVSSAKVVAGQPKWIPLSTEFGSRFRDGSAKGVILQAPNDSNQYYAYYSIGSPRIRIQYVK